MKETSTEQESAESKKINSANKKFWKKEDALIKRLLNNKKITSEAAFTVKEECEKLKKLPVSATEKEVIFGFIPDFNEAIKRAGKRFEESQQELARRTRKPVTPDGRTIEGVINEWFHTNPTYKEETVQNLWEEFEHELRQRFGDVSEKKHPKDLNKYAYHFNAYNGKKTSIKQKRFSNIISKNRSPKKIPPPG